VSEERLRGLIAAKLEGKGLDDLLAMLQGIRAQDTPALRLEVEDFVTQLLAYACELPMERAPEGAGHRFLGGSRTLVRAAHTVMPDAQPAETCTLSTMEADSVEDYVLAELVGLGHEIATAATTQGQADGAGLLWLASRLMAAGAILMEGASPASADSAASEASAASARAWLQLATAEGMNRRLAALLADALQSHSSGMLKNDEDRWATAAVILSGSLEDLADALKVERGRHPRQTFWDLEARQWIRLVVDTLAESAVWLGPALEDNPPSPLFQALVRLAATWEQVAEQQDGQAALDRALLAPSWSNLLTLASPDRSFP
jgi:hypothetical protein